MLRSREGIAQKHRDRHRADAPGDRRQKPGHLGHVLVDVPDETVFRPVHRDVDHDRSGLDHVLRSRAPACPTAATRTSARRACSARSVRARMTDRHGRVLGEQHHRHRLADDLAAPDHDRLLALQLDVVLGEERHDSRAAWPARAAARRGRGGRRSRDGSRPRPSSRSTANVTFDSSMCSGSGSWTRIPSTPSSAFSSSRSSSTSLSGVAVGKAVIPRLDAGLGARVVLLRHVDVGRRIVSDEHRREADGTAERLDLFGDSRSQLLGERLSVHANCGHGAESLLRSNQACRYAGPVSMLLKIVLLLVTVAVGAAGGRPTSGRRPRVGHRGLVRSKCARQSRTGTSGTRARRACSPGTRA